MIYILSYALEMSTSRVTFFFFFLENKQGNHLDLNTEKHY